MNVLPHRRLFYGWVVVGAVFWTFVFMAGTRAAFGVFYVALIADLGWSHASTAAVFSVSSIVGAVSGIAVGLAIDRIGPRRIMPVGALVVAAGLVLTSRVVHLWQFFGSYGVLVAIGNAGLGFGPGARLISSWFRRRRGTAFGIATAGMGVGSMVVAPVAQFAVEHVGWRTAYLLLAVAEALLLVPITAGLVREHPEDLGLHPDGEPSPLVARDRLQTATFMVGATHEPSIFRQPAFWFLIAADFCVGTGTMLSVHQVAYLVDRGFTPLVAASTVGVGGLLAAVGQLSAGTISDHLGRRLPMFVATALFVASVIMLLAVRGPADGWLLTLYTVLYGLSWGGFNTVGGTIETDILHGKRLVFRLGFIAVAFTSGGAIATWFAGAIRDQAGSYGLVFALPVGLIILSALAYSLALTARDRRWGRALAAPATT